MRRLQFLVLCTCVSAISAIPPLYNATSASAQSAHVGVVSLNGFYRASLTPDALYGTVCRNVDSNTGKEGTICIAVGEPNGDTKHFWASTYFVADTGYLKEVCVNHLHLYLSGSVVQSKDFDCVTLNNATSAFIDTNTEYLPTGHYPAQAGVFNACEYWTDGSHACTATANWFFSNIVEVGQ